MIWTRSSGDRVRSRAVGNMVVVVAARVVVESLLGGPRTFSGAACPSSKGKRRYGRVDFSEPKEDTRLFLFSISATLATSTRRPQSPPGQCSLSF